MRSLSSITIVLFDIFRVSFAFQVPYQVTNVLLGELMRVVLKSWEIPYKQDASKADFTFYLMALNESTDIKDTAQLASFEIDESFCVY